MAILSFPLEKSFSLGPKFKVRPFSVIPDSRRKAIANVVLGPLIALAASYAIATGLADDKILCMLPHCKEVAFSARPNAYWASVALLFLSGCGGLAFAIYWAKYLRTRN